MGTQLSSGEASAETKGGTEREILHKTPFPAQHLHIILLQIARAAETQLPRDLAMASSHSSWDPKQFPFQSTPVVLSVTLRSSQFAVLK